MDVCFPYFPADIVFKMEGNAVLFLPSEGQQHSPEEAREDKKPV